MTGQLNPRIVSYARKAKRAATEHWGYVLAGTVVIIVLVIIVYAIVHAVLRHRRKALLRRTISSLEELADHRDRIAQRLRDLVEHGEDSDSIAREVSKHVTSIQRELQAVDQAISSVGGQSTRLARTTGK